MLVGRIKILNVFVNFCREIGENKKITETCNHNIAPRCTKLYDPPIRQNFLDGFKNHKRICPSEKITKNTLL
jgi:hypothetical protein